jgi:steroid 5-alpha reductase family enzyme
MLTSILHLAALGALLTAALMFVLWLVQLRTSNAGIVDVCWTIALGILAVLYAALGEGTPVFRWTMAAMVAVWSLRLGIHLFIRMIGKPEDGRYHELRKNGQPAPDGNSCSYSKRRHYSTCCCLCRSCWLLSIARVSCAGGSSSALRFG